MSKLLNLLFRWAAALLVVYWLVLFVGTHVPPKELPGEPLFPHADKLAHFAGYAVLAFVAAAAWTWRRTLVLGDYLVLLAGLSCYAVVDELSQMLPFVRRHADVLDWTADTIGAAVGLAVFFAAAVHARRRGLKLARAGDAADAGESVIRTEDRQTDTPRRDAANADRDVCKR